jgi:hypothetical protein
MPCLLMCLMAYEDMVYRYVPDLLFELLGYGGEIDNTFAMGGHSSK